MQKELNPNNKELVADNTEKASPAEVRDQSLSPELQLEKRASEIARDIAEKSQIPDPKSMLTEANKGIGLDASDIKTIDESEGFSDAHAFNIEASQALGADVSRKIKSVINEGESVESENNPTQFDENELAYIQEFGNKKSPKAAEELRARYEDPRTEAGYVLNQLEEFSKSQGSEYREIPELEGKKFDVAAKEIILKAVQEQIDALLLRREQGRFQERKHESVSNEVKRYAQLIEQAQKEGDISQDLEAQHVLRQLQENVAALSFQDLAASENTLGDHGVRHLVDHNITISERILDQVQDRGQEVRAIDRLMAHQIMIDHDLGYAMDPVREPINTEGAKGQDAGHNLLAAKFIKERSGNSEDSLNKIFGSEQIAGIHEGILNHDSSEVNIKLDNTAEARQANLESAIHIADNTHAFEDKLPELLYSVPESLKTMRMMKAAAESGDSSQIDVLKESLVSHINSNGNYSESDKKALSKAAKSLTIDSYKFSVGRICGNKPEVSVDGNGKVEIKVQESAIHQEAVGLFGKASYEQLVKFVGDLGVKFKGKKEKEDGTPKTPEEIIKEMMDQGQLETDKLKFTLKIGNESATKEQGTDYQRNIETLIEDADFRGWVQEDNALSENQKVAEKMGDLEKVDGIKKLRQELMKKYNT